MANFNKNLKLLIISTVVLLEVTAVSAFATKVKAAEFDTGNKQSLSLPFEVENGKVKPIEANKSEATELEVNEVQPQIRKYTTPVSSNKENVSLDLWYPSYMNYKGQMPISMGLHGIEEGKIDSTKFKVVLKKDGKTLQEVTEGEKLKKRIKDGQVFLLAYFNYNTDGKYVVEVYDNTNTSKPVKLASGNVDVKCGPYIYHKYTSVSEENFRLTINYIDPSTAGIDNLSVELVDKLGNVAAKTNNKFDSDYEKLEYQGWDNDDFFGSEIISYNLSATLHRTGEVKPGEYKVVLKDKGNVVDLGKELTINIIDAPLIESVYVDQDKPFTSEQQSINVRVRGSNINRDQIQLKLRDESGNIITTAEKGDYTNYYSSNVDLLYKLIIPSGNPLKDDTRYFIDIIHADNVISDTNKLQLNLSKNPEAHQFEILNSYEGIVVFKTSNVPTGTECRVVFNEGTNEEITEHGFVAENGDMFVQFENNGKSIDMTNIKARFNIYMKSDNKRIGSISFDYNGYFEDETDNKIISNDTESFEHEIRMGDSDYLNNYISKIDSKLFKINLVEQGNESNVVGEIDKNSIEVYYNGIWGTVNITGKLENNKNYVYVVHVGESVYKFNNTNIVTVTDKPTIGDGSINSGIHTYKDGKSGIVIPTSLEDLSFNLVGIANIDQEEEIHVSFEDEQGNTAGEFKGKLYNSYNNTQLYGQINLTESLHSGQYFLVVQYKGKEIWRSQYSVTDEPISQSYSINNEVNKDTTEISISISDAYNVDPEKLTLNIIDANGVAVENEINKDSIECSDEGNHISYINLSFTLKDSLHQGEYLYTLLYDNIPLEAGNNDDGSKVISIGESEPKIYSSWIDTDWETNTKILKINGESLDTNSKYNVLIYKDNDMYNNPELIKQIADLSSNPSGQSIDVNYSKLYGLKRGNYRLFIEQNGKVIGETYMHLSEDAVSTNDATLSDLKVNGKTIDGFDPNKLEYTVTIYDDYVYNWINAVSTSQYAHMNINQVHDYPGTATISVTSQDGTVTNTYKIHFVVASITHGDANDDGIVNDDDASLVKETILGKKKINSDKALEASDVDGDGYITSTDYALLKRKLKGKISNLPVEKSAEEQTVESVKDKIYDLPDETQSILEDKESVENTTEAYDVLTD